MFDSRQHQQYHPHRDKTKQNKTKNNKKKSDKQTTMKTKFNVRQMAGVIVSAVVGVGAKVGNVERCLWVNGQSCMQNGERWVSIAI